MDVCVREFPYPMRLQRGSESELMRYRNTWLQRRRVPQQRTVEKLQLSDVIYIETVRCMLVYPDKGSRHAGAIRACTTTGAQVSSIRNSRTSNRE